MLFLRMMMMKKMRKIKKKRKRRSRQVSLPEDMVVEIMSRVPATSMVRLRSTSKRWNALIRDESFAKKHFVNAPRQSLVIMLIGFRLYLGSIDQTKVAPSVKVTRQFSLRNPLPDSDSDSSKEVDISRVYHCDGLLLCTTKEKGLVVWNLCSGETRWIKTPEPYSKFDDYALGRSSCNKYKILRFQSGLVQASEMEYKLYDFTSNSWRVICHPKDWWFRPLYMSRGVSVNGNTYWHAWGGSSQPDVLLSFDFSTHRFSTVSLPSGHLSYTVFGLSVTREEQQLCMIAAKDPGVFDVDVWVATKIESSGAASWTKLLSIAQQTYRPHPFCFNNGMSFLADQENKIIVCGGKHSLSKDFLTILGEDKCTQVVNHDDSKSQCSLLISYVPTLAQIQ